MQRIMKAVTAVACLASTGIAAVVPAVSRRAETVKIMPLGDSITGSPGCWRALLWQQLQNAGITNTDFVGSLPGDGCGFEYDSENEGHGGILATNIVAQNQLPPWLESAQPDIVMVHLGTNDAWSNVETAKIIETHSTLVDQMRESNPNMVILLAQIIPMNPTNCNGCGPRVEEFNSAVAEWAPTKSTEESPIVIVDCFTGFDTGTDTGDGVHPNEAGNEKIANSWFEPLSEAIKQVGG
ncbi:hypothetical protein AJ79_00616 [Helicocarpus griseus UAMH5409]|uniref:SGNH hydrolase-type esterase domain-containing protein n=1 Tax=Helicocarpus griseus UAMH5409 TaxID=1447875 RepID=A0A2B7YCF6_9EURO|nr:hypothetical protein AJ79_00616 [Helicocarpus griseus UAMH5409]